MIGTAREAIERQAPEVLDKAAATANNFARRLEDMASDAHERAAEKEAGVSDTSNAQPDDVSLAPTAIAAGAAGPQADNTLAAGGDRDQVVGRRWQATRRAVFARYGRVCWHCGLALRRDLDALRCEHRNCSNCGPLALLLELRPARVARPLPSGAPTWCESGAASSSCTAASAVRGLSAWR